MRRVVGYLVGNGLPITLVALAALGATALTAGYLLDVDSFTSNLLAEVAGVAVSVVIAIGAIDVLIERRRKQRWDVVRSSTLQSIYTHIVDAVVICLMSSPVATLLDHDEEERYWETISSPSATPDAGTAEAIKNLAEFIRQHESEFQELEEREGRFSDMEQDIIDFWKPHGFTSRDLYNEVQDELAILRDVLTPRVLELADDPDLAELLFAIERAERFWRHALWALENGYEYRLMWAWRAVAKVYEACRGGCPLPRRLGRPER